MSLIKFNNKGSAAIGLIIGISIIITGGLLFYSWRQLIPALNSANQSKTQLKAENKELETKIGELAKAQTIVNRITPSLSNLELALPNTDQFPEMLVMIGAMAQNSGLTNVSALEIGDSSTATANATDSYKPATFSITAEGLYENANIFLDNLYNNIRTIDIDSISLTSASESNSEESAQAVPGQLSFTFSGFTYSRPEKAGSQTTASTSTTKNAANSSLGATTSSNK